MSDSFRDGLVAELVPVRRVGSPWTQALAWLGLVAITAIVLAAFADLPFVVHHLMIVPDMWMAELGAVMTAVLAACATFQLCRPDRSPYWAALPLPALALWIGASCVGSTRIAPVFAFTHALMMDAMAYVVWIIGFSVPLSVAIFWLLRRGYTLFPTLTGAMAGLAVSAAAAALMVLFHPYEASLIDLLIHGSAVLLVVLVTRALGGRLFARPRVRQADGG